MSARPDNSEEDPRSNPRYAEKGREAMVHAETARGRLRAAAVAIAPAVLLTGFFYHPYISPPVDPAAIAAAAAADPTRWGLAHLTVAVE